MSFSEDPQRSFAILENVKHILSVKLRPLMIYLQEACPAIINLSTQNLLPSKSSNLINSAVPGSNEERPAVDMVHCEWAPGGSTSGSPSRLFNALVIPDRFFLIAKVNRDRCFFLIAKPGLELFKAIQITGAGVIIECINHSIDHMICCVPHLFGQVSPLLSHQDLKTYPLRTWMDGSMTPPVHQWLQNSHSKEDKERLKVCGNIVIPAMAFFAMHILQEMW